MMAYLISLTILTASVILLRALFRKNISACLTYAIWLAVVLRLCLPFDLIQVDMTNRSIGNIEEYITEELSKPLEDFGFNVSSDTPIVQENVSQQQNQTVTPTLPQTNQQVNTQNNTHDLQNQSFDADNKVSIPSDSTVMDTDEEVIGNEAISADVEEDIKISLAHILGTLWVAGSIVTLTVFGVSYLVFSIKLRRSREYYGMAGKTKIYVSDRVFSPCVSGIIPKIYITPDAASSESLSVILLHEKTHLAHGDHLWNMLRVAAVIVHWWNPLVWAAAVLSKRDAELACDESVAKRLDSRDQVEYARMIVDMTPVKKNYAVGFASGPIKERVLRLTSKHRNKIIAAILSIVLVVSCVAATFVGAKETNAVGIYEKTTAETESEDATEFDTESADEIPKTEDEPQQIQSELLKLLHMTPSEISAEYGEMILEYSEYGPGQPVYSLEKLSGVMVVYSADFFDELHESILPKELLITEYPEDIMGLTISGNIEECKGNIEWSEAWADIDVMSFRTKAYVGNYYLTAVMEYQEEIPEYEGFWDDFKTEPYGKIFQIRIGITADPVIGCFRVSDATDEKLSHHDNIVEYDVSTGEYSFDVLLTPLSDVENFKITRLTWDENMRVSSEEVIHEVGNLTVGNAVLLTVDSVEAIGYTGISYSASGETVRYYPAISDKDGLPVLVSLEQFLGPDMVYAGLPRYAVSLEESGSLYGALETLHEDEGFVNTNHKVMIVHGLSTPVYIELGTDTNMLSAWAYGYRTAAPTMFESTNLYGNINTQLYEYNGAVILSRDYYEVGDTWIFTPYGITEFHPRDDSETSVTFGLKDDGTLGYTRFAVRFNADIHQISAAPLQLAMNRDDFLRETGTVTIGEGDYIALNPENSYTISDVYDLDQIFEDNMDLEWFKYEYAGCESADDVLYVNRTGKSLAKTDETTENTFPPETTAPETVKTVVEIKEPTIEEPVVISVIDGINVGQDSLTSGYYTTVSDKEYSAQFKTFVITPYYEVLSGSIITFERDEYGNIIWQGIYQSFGDIGIGPDCSEIIVGLESDIVGKMGLSFEINGQHESYAIEKNTDGEIYLKNISR